MPILKRKLPTNLPRPYLSYSQLDLVSRNPSDYVRKYIYGEENEANIQQEYGKEITNILEGRVKCPAKLKKALATVPCYDHDDLEIQCFISRDGHKVKLYGRLDGFSLGVQGEYKTGMQPWTQKKAEASKQLKIYALIHYYVTKQLPIQKLTWLETKWDGAVPVLTGKNQTFTVKPTLKDILEIEAWVWQGHDKIINLVEEELKKL